VGYGKVKGYFSISSLFFGPAAGFHLKDTFVEVNTHGYTDSHTHTHAHTAQFFLRTKQHTTSSPKRKGRSERTRADDKVDVPGRRYTCIVRQPLPLLLLSSSMLFLLLPTRPSSFVLRVPQDALVYVCQPVGRWPNVSVCACARIRRYPDTYPNEATKSRRVQCAARTKD